MATPAVLTVDALLVPITGDNPSGRNLAYESEYDVLREARRVEDATLLGEWQHKTKLAEWDRVVELGAGYLQHQTKDLQVAAWVAEALARLHGFAGVRDGLRLMAGIQERFWQTYYPEIDDGDLESRAGPFVFLNNDKLLPLVIRSTPLTGGPAEKRYSFFRWQESRATDNVGKKDAKAMQALIAEGKITAKQFDDAVAQSPRSFYENLAQDVQQSWEAFQELDRSTDQHFGRDAPSLTNVRKALEDCRKLVETILSTKRQQEPDAPKAAPAPAAPEPGAAVLEPQAAAGEARGTPAAVDYGRVLIEFREKAQKLAEAGTKLQANRQKYAELQAQLRKLDEEYAEIVRTTSAPQESFQLLARLATVPGGAAANAPSGDGT